MYRIALNWKIRATTSRAPVTTGRTGQAEVQVDVEEVGGRFADGRAEHFDDPEVDGDFWDFVEELAARCEGVL
jgi:hypothetical protein